MIYSLRGTLVYADASAAVVECAGVGYLCRTTLNTLKNLKLNSEVTLYTYLSLREGAVDLYGFYEHSELESFKALIGVSGVGAKMALAVLSVMTPEQFAAAVVSNDLKTITRAQGVGKKIAQRILLELKDKLAESARSFGADGFSSVGSAASGNASKAAEALGVLGFDTSEVMPVLSRLDPELSVEQLISLALKQMGSKQI